MRRAAQRGSRLCSCGTPIVGIRGSEEETSLQGSDELLHFLCEFVADKTHLHLCGILGINVANEEVKHRVRVGGCGPIHFPLCPGISVSIDKKLSAHGANGPNPGLVQRVYLRLFSILE